MAETTDAPSPLAVLPAPPDRLALFLDFDGTLVAIADRPDTIEVPDGLADMLGRVADVLDGRLVLVSGRTIADLDKHIGTHRLAVSGSHGLETRLPGDEATNRTDPVDVEAVRLAVLEALDAPGNISIETKKFGLAIHFRKNPARQGDVEQAAQRVAARFDLAMKPGKMVVEISAPGGNKGGAVRTIMANSGFANSVPVFIGDDVTDEDGFKAAIDLGGSGILVGERKGSVAKSRLAGPAAVLELLNSIAETRA